MPQDELSAGSQCVFRCSLQAAAAGDLHADDGDALNVVIADDRGQLFSIVHRIQLRATDDRDLSFLMVVYLKLYKKTVSTDTDLTFFCDIMKKRIRKDVKSRHGLFSTRKKHSI